MMNEKRFTFIKDTVATNLKTPIVYNNEKMSIGEVLEMLNNLYDENEQLKQRINSRLHFYRELYESTNDNVVKRVIEDLEDILK